MISSKSIDGFALEQDVHYMYRDHPTCRFNFLPSWVLLA